MGTTHRL